MADWETIVPATPAASSDGWETLEPKKTTAPAPPAEDLTKPSFQTGKSGIVPKEKQAARGEVLHELFGRDPSKAGKLSGSDYLQRAAKGAAWGGGIGAGIGAVTGPGALATGLLGAGGGAISGLAEAAAEDLGFGKGTQVVAGLVAPQPGGAVSKAAREAVPEPVRQAIADKARPIGDMIAEAVGHKMFGWGVYPAKRAMQALEKSKPVDVKAFEEATGVPGKSTIMPGSVENVTKARQDLATKYGVDAEKAESQVYEQAKTAYDESIRKGESFTRSPEFKALIEKYPEKSRGFMAQTYGSIFQQGKSLKPGDTVINDLKNLNLTPTQTKEVQSTFNDYLERVTGKRWEQEARGAAESVFVANAKDQLPSLLMNSGRESAASPAARKMLKQQIQNYSKNADTRKIFFEETAHALKNMPAGDAKMLWNSIGPEVNKYLIRDPETYNKITRIMSGARTPKEVSNAVRLILKAQAASNALTNEE